MRRSSPCSRFRKPPSPASCAATASIASRRSSLPSLRSCVTSAIIPASSFISSFKKLGRFARPGVRATGDRTQRNPGAGVESLHVAIDDHSRLAFACLLPDETIPSVLNALHQAIAFYKAHGITIQSVLTDRGSSYRSKLFAAGCRQLGLKHLFTRPYRPQTNGKAERFIQTITREWAYARSYQSSDHRATFLPYFLFDYNHHRPHSALHSLPPLSRLNQSATNLLTINS